ncbi:MAG: SgcJ/EcaC family oxidoreductase, partial [Chloroflexi bacterium]
MSSQTFQPQDSLSPDEIEVRALYRQILDGWNKRSADAFAAPFADDGDSIGFDGSQLI